MKETNILLGELTRSKNNNNEDKNKNLHLSCSSISDDDDDLVMSEPTNSKSSISIVGQFVGNCFSFDVSFFSFIFSYSFDIELIKEFILISSRRKNEQCWCVFGFWKETKFDVCSKFSDFCWNHPELISTENTENFKSNNFKSLLN